MKGKLFIVGLATVAPVAALADRPGDHPAVIVKRLYPTQGYDYASKFYPHPAWLYLLPEAPSAPSEDPALIASRHRQPDRTTPSIATPQVAVAPGREGPNPQ